MGRVVEINYGPQAGSLAVIVDLVDQSRALIDGPAIYTGVERQTIPYRQLSLTEILLPIQRSVRSSTLAKAFKAANVQEVFNKSNWAKKAVQQQVRSELTDFERFKVMVLKIQRNHAVKREVAKLKKSAKPAAKSTKSTKSKAK